MTSVNQTWYVLQANAQVTSQVISGPIFDQTTALNTCQQLAAASPGVAYVVVMTVAGFVTEPPQAVPLTITAQAGQDLMTAQPAPTPITTEANQP